MSICARPVLRCSAIGEVTSLEESGRSMPPGNDRPLQTCSLQPNGRPGCRSVKKTPGLPGKPPRQTKDEGKARHMQRLSWLLLAIAVPALAAADGGVSSTS